MQYWKNLKKLDSDKIGKNKKKLENCTKIKFDRFVKKFKNQKNRKILKKSVTKLSKIVEKLEKTE